MKRIFTILIALALLFAMNGPTTSSASSLAWTIPTFSIVSVSADNTVTIRTYNFPKNDHFRVTMGKMGSRGVKGIYVGEFNSGKGGSFTATFDIPEELIGKYQIAIRAQATTGSGFFAYNWFYNNTTGSRGGGDEVIYYGKIPTFSIVSVARNESVTIRTSNFPANRTWDVKMGKIGTLGIKGIVVATINSGEGGSFKATFNIPEELQGRKQIAIRLESHTGGFFAYNWFYNAKSGTAIGGGDGDGKAPGTIGYSGFPTFSIQSVQRNKNVTIVTRNLPANDQFKVLMNVMGSRGVNGIKVAKFNSGDGGKQTLTFEIPGELVGKYQIAIRLQSTTGSGFFAYNWFYNTTAY